MTTLIEQLMVGLGIDTKGFQEGLDKAQEKAKGAGGMIVSQLSAVGGGVVMGAFGAVSAGVMGAVGAAGAGIAAFGSWAGTLDSMGDVLGTNADESAALAVAIREVGGNVEGITSQMSFLSRGLLDAKGEMGPTGKVLEGLGISFRDANGEMLPTTDILTQVADKLAGMPDGLEKTALMTDIFGKSGKDLTDVMNNLANGGLAKAGEKAKQYGLAIGDEASEGAVKFGIQMENMKMGLQGFLVQIGGALMPGLSTLAGKLQETLANPAVQAGIANLVSGISDFVMKVVGAIPVVIQWFQNLAAFLMENQGIIVGILVALGVAVGVFVWTTVIPAVVAMLVAMAPIILVLAGIALVVGLLYTAWTKNFGGIQDKTKAVIDWIKGFISGALALIKGWWDAHGEQVKTTVTNFWEGIKTAFQTAIDFVKRIIDLFQSGTKQDWQKFGADLRQKWSETWDKIKEKIGELWDWFKEWIPRLGKNVIEWFKAVDWTAIGKGLLEGIWAGINRTYDWLKKKVTTWVGSFLAFIKGLLGINSPSKAMMEVGRYMVEGLALGWGEPVLAAPAVNGLGPQSTQLNGFAGRGGDGRTVVIYGGVVVDGRAGSGSVLEDLAGLGW